MKKITFDNPHRQKHFEFFNSMNHPHFNITAPVCVDRLIQKCKTRGISTHLAIVYVISRVANEIPQFRWRIRGDEVVEHSSVHPSFTVPTKVADVFSFCTVDYDANTDIFLKRANQVRKQMELTPNFEDEKGRDDYLFLSSFPWVAFTGYQHAMQYHPHDSVPRISWGKIHEVNGQMMMPLSLQVHHAIVDGSQVGIYFERVEELAKDDNLFRE